VLEQRVTTVDNATRAHRIIVIKTWVELHDSEVLRIERAGSDGVVLELDAYVHRWERVGDHWRGTGWAQPVRCTIRDVREKWQAPTLPARIDDGHLQAHDSWPGNLIPLPFQYDGEVRLSLLFESTEHIDWLGRSVQLEATGAAAFLEDLPEELKPDAGFAT
jgi:hypothetical protein